MYAPQISIVIPTYNTASYLAFCINSILLQHFKNFEMIIVDDDSNDNSWEIIESYSIRDSRIHPIRLSSHTNVTNATKIGISQCSSDIVTIIDSDDMLYGRSVFELILPLFAYNPEMGFIWSKFERISGKASWSKDLPENCTLFDALTKRNWWGACHHKFFRKSIYEQTQGLDTKYDRSSDFQLALLLSTTNCKTFYIPKTTYIYRDNRKNSLSSEGRELQRCAVTQMIGELI